MNDTNSTGDSVEDIGELLAQYARVNRDLASMATNPTILKWRDAERAKANIEAAIKEEAHKRTDSVTGSGYVVKVTRRTSVNWMGDILAERLPWLLDTGHVQAQQVTTYTPDKKKLEKLVADRSIDPTVRDILQACRTETSLTPSVSIAVDAESILLPFVEAAS